jgi:hypothetical protein
MGAQPSHPQINLSSFNFFTLIDADFRQPKMPGERFFYGHHRV